MLDDFKNFIRDEGLFDKNDGVLLAVSGGLDSALMAWLFREAGFSFAIAHCNFRMRGDESDGDEMFVRQLAKKYGVRVFIKSFPTEEYAKKEKLSVQMAARELRYRWFEEIRKKNGFSYVATAHHLDDQAETFFINLLRGTGLPGLHGILPKQGKIVRPMLFTRRAEILAFAEKNRIGFREDSSNMLDKYLRNRIRKELIPLMNKLNPGFSSAISETISHLRGFEMIGDARIAEIKSKILRKEGKKILIDIHLISRLEPLQPLAWEILSPYGFNKSAVNGIVNSLDGSPGKTFFSVSHRLTVDRKFLIIESLKRKSEKESFRIADFKRTKQFHKPVLLSLSKITLTEGFEIPAGESEATLDLRKLTFPLTIRKWVPGDSFHPFGMTGKKKISDFLTNRKLPLPDKELVWLLCSGEKIVWVIGHRIDNRFRVTSRTSEILRLSLRG